MKPTKMLAAAAAGAALLLASCSTPRNIAYFQDASPGSEVVAEKLLEIRVRPEDKLSIIVTAQDPELSALFNLVQTQNRLQATTSATATSANAGDGRTGFYTVDSRGDINFPVLGPLHIAGMRREEVGDYIVRELRSRNLVKDPIVTVEFANTGLSIIGEVSSPGRYEFNKDRLSILDAIAMAGDLKPNGQRQNVKVLRETAPGRQEVYTLDLTDMHSLAKSPAYYLQQNDVVYVEPNDKSKRETTPNGNTPFTPAFWVSMGSFAITIATMIITLSK